MSLDYKKGTYRPSRPNTRNITSYGSMCKWMQSRNENVSPRGALPQVLLERANPSPKFTKKRPMLRPSPAGMPTMYDTYVNQASVVLDEAVPVHLRYSQHCGYDDFHKAFRAMGDKHPDLTFPHFGPPRLRHGRQGGSWRHVKEVLQAGGSRIVFVDGQVSSDDIMKLDNVPGGHLILPSIDRKTPSPRLVQQMNRLNEDNVEMAARSHFIESQKGLEKDNWHIMR